MVKLNDCRGLPASGEVVADKQVERSEIPPRVRKSEGQRSEVRGRLPARISLQLGERSEVRGKEKGSR